MSALMQSQIFFFISSVGFVVLWIATAVALFYLIRAIKTFSRIINKLEKDIENIGDTTEELLGDIRDSSIFQFFFRGKKKRSKAK
jgi:uncharacterized protein YoxC